MTEHSEDLSLEEFTRRFTIAAIKLAGFETFEDGSTVAAYCKEAAPGYFNDPLARPEGPEACALEDMRYWGEE
ncbi:hypothetical protein ABEB22_10670 [Thioclava sp. 'Guangxiensis']|uniref:hypothetical protein n=1 Tax=Thioclava sp. 'Guangxiensis' TaxID=3149044 RepID=UPI003877C4FA